MAVIGPTGRNFAAGMSGGVVYVLDRDHDFYRRVNKDLVSVEPLEDPEDIQELREMLAQHWEATGSPRPGRSWSGLRRTWGTSKSSSPGTMLP